MGWKWVGDDEPSDSPPVSGRGFGDAGELDTPRSAEGWCSTRRIVSANCRTEEVEPGRFVRKCEKTEQTLRDCIGRPTEVVESKTEHTEDDITDEIKSGVVPFGSSGAPSFTFPGLRSDIETIEQGLLGGFSNFLDAVEEMANGLFSSFNVPSISSRESPLFGGRGHAERKIDQGPSNENSRATYSDIAGEIKEV